MHDVQVEAGRLQLVLHNDDETPLEFVIELLHSVFRKLLAAAFKFKEAAEKHGQAICGTCPRDVANALPGILRQILTGALNKPFARPAPRG